jgi:hypothetical protein
MMVYLDIWWEFKYARLDLAAAGTQTVGLAFGGIHPTVTGATEEYDGQVGLILIL